MRDKPTPYSKYLTGIASLLSYQANIGLIIVAAGRGERAGNAGGPKQYRPLGTSTVIAETLHCFDALIAPSNIVAVIHPDDEALFGEAIAGLALESINTCHGGATRQESVFAGLQELQKLNPGLTHVMIHDAARPFVSTQLLYALLEEAGAAPDCGILPTLPIAETLKTVQNGIVTGTASRADMHRAQTPQMFPLQAICKAHEMAAAKGENHFTDDAALFEWMGLTVRTVEGDAANIKLTYPNDFPKDAPMIALPDVRTGNGYDVHIFGDGNKVTLCGVDIPFSKSLSGHSDADVGLHALTDALLATCGAGDIGDHFPPSDPQWKGMASHVFLTKAVEIVKDRGGTIMNADVTIVAEAPKIAPHRQAMREKLSGLLSIDLQRCSVKATTNEKMGFVGREEGIMALATASVVYGVQS